MIKRKRIDGFDRGKGELDSKSTGRRKPKAAVDRILYYYFVVSLLVCSYLTGKTTTKQVELFLTFSITVVITYLF